jgi:hypothetical protein
MTKSSIEGTDKAVQDNAELIKLIANNISSVPEMKAWLERPENRAMIEKANKNADEMAEDIRKYYEILGKRAGDEDRDRIVRGLATVSKQLAPD